MLFLKNKMLTEQIQYAIVNPRNRDNIGTTNTHIHDSSLSLLGIGTSKKGAAFYGPKASLVYECFDLQQVDDFLQAPRFPSSMKLTATI
jgi:hypothetical protein